MAKVRYLGGAKRDFAHILDYIFRESGSMPAARRFVDLLRDRCQRLAQLPGRMGRPRPEIREDLRSVAFRGYVILFRYTSTAFEVVNVIEGHRDIGAHFDDPDE